MKRLSAIVLTVVIALVGCQGTNNTKDTTTNDNTRPENTTYEQTRYNDKNVTHNERFTEMRNREDGLNRQNERDKNNYRVSKEAAEQITSEIDEINQAYVLTTRNNAYVAATLKDNENRDSKNDANRDSKDNVNRQTDDNVNVERTRTDDQNTTNNRSTRHNTDNDFQDGDELTDDVKNQISDIVQSVDRNIDNVYVTTSPDFANLSEQYANDLDEGRPIRGFFDQIGNAIERLFPQDKGTQNQNR